MVFYIDSTQSPYSLNLRDSFTRLLPLEDVKIFVDTSTGPVSIMLEDTSSFPVENVKFFVKDTSGNAAANNITIFPAGGDTINGAASLVINANNGFARVYIGFDGQWTATGSGIGGGFALTDGNATTANGTAVDLGGNLIQDTIVQWDLINNFIIWGDALGGGSFVGWGNFGDGVKRLNADVDAMTLTASDAFNQYTLGAEGINSGTTVPSVGVTITDLGNTFDYGFHAFEDTIAQERVANMFYMDLVTGEDLIRLNVFYNVATPANSFVEGHIHTNFVLQDHQNGWMATQTQMFLYYNALAGPDILQGTVWMLDAAGISYIQDNVALFEVDPTGEITESAYPNTRDDTGTFPPTSFYYPGPAGERYVAPLSEISAIQSNTYSNWDSMRLLGTLPANQTILITDRWDTGIKVTVSPNDSLLSLPGVAGFLNPDFQDIGNYANVAVFTGIAKGTNRGVWYAPDEVAVPYVNGDIVFYNGIHFQVIDDTAFDGLNPPTINTVAYQCLPKTTQTINYSNLVGAFDIGETISGDNGSTGIILSDDGVGTMEVTQTSTYEGNYLANATNITGTVSGATADIDTITNPVAETGLGYIERWYTINYNFISDVVLMVTDEYNNVVQHNTFTTGSNSISVFQWGNANVFSNQVIQSSILSILNQGAQGGGVSGNTIASQSSVEIPESTGNFQGNTVSNSSSLTFSGGNTSINVFEHCNTLDVTNSGNFVACYVAGVVETSLPSSSIYRKRAEPGFSNFEISVSITGLTTIDLLTAGRLAGVINLTSANATETIDTIANIPDDPIIRALWPYRFYPESGLAVTFTGTAIAGAAAGDIVLPTANFVADGSTGDWLEVEVDRAGIGYSLQKDAMNYI